MQGFGLHSMAAVLQPRQRDAFMLTPSLTQTRLMQPSPQPAASTLELSQQEVSLALQRQCKQPSLPAMSCHAACRNSGGLCSV